MEESSIKFIALMSALLIFSPPFINVGLQQLTQQLTPETILRSHETTVETFEIDGVTYTIPINKTYIVFKNGTSIYNIFLETEFVKINYTKIVPSRQVQSNSIHTAGELVRDWYDGLLFIYDCPLNSIYYGHPDHYYTYPDEDHLMMWNLPWEKKGDTKNHIHISQDEITAMKSEDTILPDVVKRALISTFGTLVIGGVVVPHLWAFLVPLVGTVIGAIIVAITVFVIWLIAWLIGEAVETPDFIEDKVELYHHDGFMWTWDAEKGFSGLEIKPPVDRYDIPTFFKAIGWYYIKFNCAYGKELWEGTVHYIETYFSIPMRYYMTLG